MSAPDLDVLLFVLDGTGHLTTEIHTIDLHPGALIWLPSVPGASCPPDHTA